MKNSKYNNLMKSINYKFQDENLLVKALTHKSLGFPNNERLEFLGDSILNLVISSYVFENYPNETEGSLSILRSNIVSSDTLVEIANLYDIHKFIMHRINNVSLQKSMIADSLEALIAAIYIDSNFKICSKVVIDWFKTKITNTIKSNMKDSKSRLQELLQKKKYNVPLYTLVSTHGKEHTKSFKVLCSINDLNITSTGVGTTLNKAQQEAAKHSLDMVIKHYESKN